MLEGRQLVAGTEAHSDMHKEMSHSQMCLVKTSNSIP